MKLSYNWLTELIWKDHSSTLPGKTPQELGDILTAVGLEVEGIYLHEEIKNSLAGLVVGEVLTCDKHPDADKLKVANVKVSEEQVNQIVCGAPNIAPGQKVIVALPGTEIHPISGEPFTIKDARIRGVKSSGMICAEDEIGLGESHDGIYILPNEISTGSLVSEFFKPYEDYVLEIGLTPNRMSAMSHRGAAKDVCAFISHHNDSEVVLDGLKGISTQDNLVKPCPIEVKIIDTEACHRYSGIYIENITVGPSPKWMQHKLKTVGIRPINNIVDITNYVLQETGQPLHAFDADKISGNAIHVRFLPAGTPFKSLDEKDRKLNDADLMICDADDTPMCIGGVFGGVDSGVSESTKNIFLESAWFHPRYIRNSSFRHGLRTDAATHFEKGVDISNTVNVLLRAAGLIEEHAGGKVMTGVVDEYPVVHEKAQVQITSDHVKSLSGKDYQVESIEHILKSLDFVVNKDGDFLNLEVPLSNPDITMPADIVEEIMRIDGLDNIPMAATASIALSTAGSYFADALKSKITGWLTGRGFSEIFTNSITRSWYYSVGLKNSVRIINSINEELDIMRPAMLFTGLESISYNINRRITDLQFFEFGKVYLKGGAGFLEEERLAIYITGDVEPTSWNRKQHSADIWYIKGLCQALLTIAGIGNWELPVTITGDAQEGFDVSANGNILGTGQKVSDADLQKFSIKQDVFFISLDWNLLVSLGKDKKVEFTEIPKYPSVNRDLSMVVDNELSYGEIENTLKSLDIKRLKHFNLFDVFQGKKLGEGKKSVAVNFNFLDESKTLTDAEVEKMMQKIIAALEKQSKAEIRTQATHENA